SRPRSPPRTKNRIKRARAAEKTPRAARRHAKLPRSFLNRGTDMRPPAPPPPPPKEGRCDPAHEHDSCGIGFVVDAHGRKSHSIVEQGVQVLLNLEHRGACGCEKNTCDAAGILMQMPHRFLAEECDRIGITLPAAGRYGAGIVFLPRDPRGRAHCEE